MSVWGCTMMKDEADVAFGVVAHLVEEGLDGVLVADNLSNDSTRLELDAVSRWAKDRGCEVVVVEDREVGYYQSRKMTNLAHRAHEEFGADWIVPFDADEIWYSRLDRINIVLEGLPDEVLLVQAPLFNHFTTAVDEVEDDPFRRMTWRQVEAGALPKVAVRWREDLVIHQGNHSAHFEHCGLVDGSVRYGELELRHFPYRSFEHFKRKAINGARAYNASNLHETEGAHWRQYGELYERLGDDGLRAVYLEWFNFLAPVNAGLIHDPAPYRRWNK